MYGVAQHARMHSGDVSAFNPQLLGRTFRAYEVVNGLKPNAAGVRPATARALWVFDKLNRAPAWFAKIKIPFRENSDPTLPAQGGKEEVFQPKEDFATETLYRRWFGERV
jgi:hypothetical protein